MISFSGWIELRSRPMASNLGLNWKFGASDGGLSSAADKAKAKFSGLTKATQRANRAFKVMSSSTSNLRKGLNNMGNGFKSAGTKMTAGLTLPVVGFGVSVIRTAAQFEESMNSVAAKSGATGKTLEKLKMRAREMGANTAFSAKEAADSMAFLAQAGWDTKQIYTAIPAVLNLAAASGASLAEAGDIASNIMGAFNIEAEKAGNVADILAKTTASANVDMIQLAEAMKDAAPVAQKYGASLEETSALIGKLGDAGIQGSKAGTTLKNMFLRLSAPTKSIANRLGQLGVKTFNKTTGEMRSMTDILADMDKAFKLKNIKGAERLTILNEVFGQRAIAGAGVLLDQAGKIGKDGVNNIARFTGALENSGGAAKNMADTMMKGLPGALKTLQSKFMEFQLAIMDPKTGLSQAFGDIVNSISGLLTWLSKLNPKVIAWAVKIGLVVAAVGPLLLAFGAFLSMSANIVTAIIAIKSALVAAQIGLAPLLLMMAKFVLVAGLLATAAVMIYNEWEPIKQFFSDLFTNPLQEIQDMVKWIGKISGISSFFGGDKNDEVDAKLKAMGFKISEGGSKGAPVGSKEVTKKSNAFEAKQKKAMIGVNFSNAPKGTQIQSEDKGNILDITSGSMVGGI
jgi:TP901 family phage tail tape measure protein